MANSLTENKIGSLAYSIYVDGELVETVEADDAIEYLHGAENIVPGLERELEGLSVGDSFDITVAPADAYGEYDEDAIEAIPADEFEWDEEGGELVEGLEVEMMDDEGEIIEGVIVGFEDDMVLVDLNPPLAGKTIRYVGNVVEVRDATEEELEWGLPESLLEDFFPEDEEDYEED